MSKVIIFLLSLISLALSIQFNLQGQTIEQKLFILQNDQTIGGNFKVQVQVKGTSLPVANTLGSATIDIQFNNLHLAYVSSSNWAFGFAQGYSRSVTNNITFLRVAVTGLGVNQNGDGDPPGFDIGSSYYSWVQLNFIIQDLANTSLTIINATNAIGLFENHSNEPITGVINNQILTAPENILNVPLPVELSSFTGQLIKNTVYLKWESKTEINNSGFNVERRINEGEWNTVGFVQGSGNTTLPKEYNFVDKDIFGGSKFEYRLKQIDYNGTFEYSEIVELELEPLEFELLQNYPNPFNPSTTIRFSLPQTAKINLNLYNLLGELVKTLAEGTYEAGYHKVDFDASALASGVYLYRIESESFTQQKKMILLR